MKRIVVSLILAGTLTACHTTPTLSHADYWRRTQLKEAIYLNGESAQKRLHRDIARCVTDIKRIQTMTTLRTTIPASAQNSTSYDAYRLRNWDTPERNGALRAEHTPYHTVEKCMEHKGWQRARALSYDEIERGQSGYYQMYYNR